MKLSKDKVGLFNYTLTDSEGKQIDSSNNTPIAYLHGYNNLYSRTWSGYVRQKQ